jgi:hypothetical protein
VKRLFLGLLTIVALTACASPLAKTETPQQALTGAAQRASQLHSAKFDMQAHVNMTFPAQLASIFGQTAGTSGSLAVDLTGNGEAQFPDRYHASVNVKMSSLSVATETIVAGGKVYVKNPLTQKWQVSTAHSLTDQVAQPDPLSYDQFLKNVKSIKDLGDTTLNGTAVHHYQLTPDKDKLVASVGKAKSAEAAAALKQVLDSGTMTVEVWFGKDDHLVRRISVNLDYNIDLNQLMGALGSAAGTSASKLPAGSAVHATATVLINYHDFDAPVTITIPTVG